MSTYYLDKIKYKNVLQDFEPAMPGLQFATIVWDVKIFIVNNKRRITVGGHKVGQRHVILFKRFLNFGNCCKTL